jgi:dihydrofolate reductase
MPTRQRKPRFGFNTAGNVIHLPHNQNGRNVTIIAAHDLKQGIGFCGDIPWKLSADLKHFKRLTKGHTVIMGRKTWESIGSKPLPDRVNMVVTRDIGKFYSELDKQYIETVVAMPSLEVALAAIENEQVFIIGGGEIYREALAKELVDDMIITEVQNEIDFAADTYFPQMFPCLWLPPVYSSHKEGNLNYRFIYYCRKRQESIYTGDTTNEHISFTFSDCRPYPTSR